MRNIFRLHGAARRFPRIRNLPRRHGSARPPQRVPASTLPPRTRAMKLHGVDCPTGKSPTCLSSPLFKNISLFAAPKSHAYPSRPGPQRGVSRSSLTLGMGCGGRGSVGRVRDGRAGFGLSQTRERSNGAQTTDVEADGKAVWSWHPLLMPSWRRCVGPTGLRQAISANDGDKTNSSPGRARRKPLKPLRGECRVSRRDRGD
jgi:hypothetical protein